LITFIISFTISILLTPFFILFGRKAGFVDRPDGILKPHTREIPYLGGIGIFFALLPFLWQHSSIFLIFSIITALGFLDDVFDLSPKLRLLLEIILITYIVITFHNIFDVWLFLFIFGGVALVNAVNMVDGLDGICAGNVAISALFLVLLSSSAFSKSLSFSLLGASLGFLLYNFPPAKVFLGDSGSYLLGISLTSIYLSNIQPPSFKKVLLYIFPLWLYFLDLIAGVIRRIRNRKNPFSGDRDHFYDKLRRRLSGEKRVALITYLINATFSSLAFLSETSPIAALTVAILLSTFLLKALNLIGYD